MIKLFASKLYIFLYIFNYKYWERKVVNKINIGRSLKIQQSLFNLMQTLRSAVKWAEYFQLMSVGALPVKSNNFVFQHI